jgi:asparagine synthetase B (glutamine-hydrolysing)
VLFSGGIDSVVLAALCHRHVPSDQLIDLINVSFFGDSHFGSKVASTPDRLAAILSVHELTERFPEQSWRFIAVDVPYQQERHILQLIAPLESTMDFNIATAFCFAGRGEGRVLGMNEMYEARQEINSNNTASTCQHEQPLVRFSTAHNKANISIESSIASKSMAGANITSDSNGQVSSKHGIVISQAKILLSGVDADQQMAGYGRH